MADDLVKLRIELEARGVKSMKDLELQIKTLRKNWKDYAIGSKEATVAGKQLVGLLETKSKVAQTVVTANGKMMQSYFKLGTQLRSTQVAAINMGRVIQDAPYGMIGMANNINPLVESLSRLKAEAAATGITMKRALIGTLMGAGGLSIAVSAVSALMIVVPKILDSIGESAKKTEDKLKKLNDELDRMTKIADKFATEDPVEAQARQAMLMAEQETLDKRMRIYTYVFDQMRSGGGPVSITEKEEREAGLVGIAIGIDPKTGAFWSINGLKAYLAEMREAMRDNAQKMVSIGSNVTGYRGGGASTERGTPGALTPGGFRSGASPTSSRLARIPTIPQIQTGVADIFAEIDAGQRMMSDTFSAMGTTIQSHLGSAFEMVFGQANSLLEQFGQQLAKILGQRLIGTLLSFIPGVGPILGAAFGTFSSGLTAGSSAPAPSSTFTPRGGGGNQMALNRMSNAISNGVWRVRGGDLVYATDAGRRQIARRLF